MYQKVTLIGNLGNDPEQRFTPSGTAITQFRMATNEVFNDKEGNRQKRTTWWRISAWGKLGEICNQYLKKGSKVLVEGTVVPDDKGNPRIWKTQDGEPRASFELRAQTVKFLDARGTGGEPSEGAAEEAAPAEEHDDMPF
jgi:single-strand DNA-binding protein